MTIFLPLENKITRQEQEDADRKKITAAVGDAKAYVQALRDFAKNHPAAESAAALNRAAEESTDWNAWRNGTISPGNCGKGGS